MAAVKGREKLFDQQGIGKKKLSSGLYGGFSISLRKKKNKRM